MCTSNQLTKGILLLCILLLGALGCNREPPVVQPPPLEVVICKPVTDKIEDWDTYTGNVDAKDKVEVKSRVRGHVKDVNFKEGEEIAADVPLLLIDDEPFKADLEKAKGELTTAEARKKSADDRLVIYKPLAEKGTVAREELIKVETDLREAIGAIDSSKGRIRDAELNIGYCKITSPIAGKVGEVMVSKGNLVNSSGEESLLTTVVAVDPMYVNFYVNERAYQNYRNLLLERAKKDPNAPKGTKVKIPVKMAIGGAKTFDYDGEVDFVDNRVDAKTGSIKVRARFENPKGLDDRRPLTVGMFARIRVAVSDPYPALLIADRAVLTDQSLKYVLVVNKNKEVERKDILIADRVQENGLRAVQGGLNGDEWIIVEGVNRARPGTKVEPKEAEMPRRPVGK